MNRSELIKKVGEGSVSTPRVQPDEIISLILDEIVRAVDAGERVEIRGFGTFFPRERQTRMGRNPRTGESVSVDAKRVLFFKAGRELLRRLNSKKTGKAVRR